jgi:glycerate 2-kinase
VTSERSIGVVFAPDSFKGSLTSLQVARALATGWARGRPGDRISLAPLADGGEGTLVAIEAAGGWQWQEAQVADPLGRPIRGRWLRSTDGLRAVVEMAEASGLSRVAPADRDPLRASTYGTGQLILDAIATGARHLVLGIGGSATTDGGLGLIAALGGLPTHEMPDPTVTPDRVDLHGLDPRLAQVDLRIACDVTNPLLGERGAAAIYGPQKGAGPAQVELLDRRLERWADVLEAAAGRSERDTPGAGAAGGLGFGLLAIAHHFRSLELVSGVDLVMDETDLAGKLAGAALVVTGEGRIDAQTAFGKTALGVAGRARAAGIACIAVGGGVDPDGIAALVSEGVLVVPVAEQHQSVEAAMAAGATPLERCGERLARLISLGATIA